MANPNFDGIYSTHNIWRDDDETRCLSDDLAAIEGGIEALDEGKAPADHTHTGFAPASHSHDGYAPASHSHDYAAPNHGHSYNDLSDKPTIPAAYNHPDTHPMAMISGLEAALDSKAAAGHTHLGYSGASASTYKLVYVGLEGSDNNDGTSQAAPMATIKGAIRKYAESYKFLDIRLLDGTYNEDIGAIGTDVANLSIRSASENKDAVTINMATQLDLNSGTVRLYNMTLNVTATGVRGISVNAGALYAHGIRVNLPAGTTVSCVNVYNGTHAFLMNCVLNAGTGSNAGAAVYGNQAMMVKAINCTSECKVNVGVHAHNGSDIVYTDTLNATTKTKQTSWGKCTLRS